MTTIEVPLTARRPKPTRADRMRSRTLSIIQYAKVFVAVYGVVGIICGLSVARITTERGFLSQTEYPYIGLGIGISLANVAVASFMYAVLQFMEWRTEAGVRREGGEPGFLGADTVSRR